MATEKRLIDKDKLLEKLGWLAKNEDQFRQSVIGGVMHTIAVTPTVDAVEVVRCKDCKHYNKDSLWCGMNSRDRAEWFNWYEDDFCSYGERKDNETV